MQVCDQRLEHSKHYFIVRGEKMLRNNQLGIRVRISMELCGIVLDCSLRWPPNMCLLPLPHPLLRSPRLSLSLPHHPSLRARADFEHIDLNTQWNSLGSPRISRYNNLHWPNSQHYIFLSYFLSYFLFFLPPNQLLYSVCDEGRRVKGEQNGKSPHLDLQCGESKGGSAVLFVWNHTETAYFTNATEYNAVLGEYFSSANPPTPTQ